MLVLFGEEHLTIEKTLDEILNLANIAVKADRKGSKSKAIQYYVQASEKLIEIAQLTKGKRPDLAANLISMAEKYLKRIEELRGSQIEGQPGKEEVAVKVKDLILTQKPNVKWTDIAGLEDVKKHIMAAVVLPMLGKVKRSYKGILLYGPPGCGKTMLAKAAATELNATFIYARIPLITSKWFGETEKIIHYIFKEARKRQPTIIFIDEIDALFAEEASSSVISRLRGVILTEMDGLLTGPKEKVVVLAATNRPWMLDAAVRQRFQYRVYVPLPDFEARKKIFELNTRDMDLADDVDFDKLAELTEGYSGREIATICMEAELMPWWEIPVEKWSDPEIKPRKVTMQDFIEAINKIKPQVTEEEIRMYEKFSKQI